jgi:hypothetical protein
MIFFTFRFFEQKITKKNNTEYEIKNARKKNKRHVIFSIAASCAVPSSTSDSQALTADSLSSSFQSSLL